MRRIISITLIVLSLFLVACNKKQNVNSNHQYTSINVDKISHNDRCLLGWSEILETENGYYQWDYDAIYYIDKDNKERMYLCGKPECIHKSTVFTLESCDAYVGECIIASMRVFGDYLYLVKYDSITYQTTMSRISMDGSVHEDLFVIGSSSKNIGKLYEYVVYEGYIYIATLHEKDYKYREFSKYNIANGEKEVIYQYTDDEFEIVSYCDNYIIYKNEKNAIYKYDILKNKSELITETGDNTYVIKLNGYDNSILFWEFEKGLNRFDLETGETTLIYEKTDNMDYVSIACNSKYIVLDNFMYQYRTENWKREVIILDFKGNRVAKVDMSDDEQSMVQYCGEDYLIAVDEFAEGGIAIEGVDFDNLNELVKFEHFVWLRQDKVIVN